MRHARAAHAKVNAVPRFRHPIAKKQRDFSPGLRLEMTSSIPETSRRTGLCVKESSGHVRKIFHLRRVAPATALLQAVVLAARPDVCGETERNFSSRRATGRHSAAVRDDRPVASFRRGREGAGPLAGPGPIYPLDVQSPGMRREHRRSRHRSPWWSPRHICRPLHRGLRGGPPVDQMSREGRRGGRTSGATSDLLARGRARGYLQRFSALLPSSSGPGRRPLTAKTGVRVP